MIITVAALFACLRLQATGASPVSQFAVDAHDRRPAVPTLRGAHAAADLTSDGPPSYDLPGASVSAEVAVSAVTYYKMGANAAACPTGHALASEAKCRTAAKSLDVEFAFNTDDDLYPVGCFILHDKAYFNMRSVGPVSEQGVAVCITNTIAPEVRTWTYPAAARLDSTGRAAGTTYEYIGAGLCQDAAGRSYPGDSAPKYDPANFTHGACRDYCLGIGNTEGLAGFTWGNSGGEEINKTRGTCRCAVDAEVFETRDMEVKFFPGVGEMGVPAGEHTLSPLSCFERRYTVVEAGAKED